MNSFEADRCNLAGIFQATGVGGRQLLQAFSHRDGVIGHGGRHLFAMAADFDEAWTGFGTDPFDPTPSELPLVGHIEQPILKARRSEIGYENLH
jgi:hypothetical protein